MIGGEYEDDNYTELDIIMAPCNYVHTMYGYTEDSVHPECYTNLKRQWDYVGPSQWLFLMNQERINLEEFGSSVIQRFSEIKTQQFDERTPNYVNVSHLVNSFGDESDVFQYGQEDFDDFIQVDPMLPQASAWNDHPMKNSTGLYKFTSAHLLLDQRVLQYNRSTYDVLSWLGDIGGLVDCLLLIGRMFLLPMTTFNMHSILLTYLFRLVPRREQPNA